MTQPLIVGAVRSPIGRARKGSLVDLRGDDLLVQVIEALLERVPQLDRTAIEDLFVGTWEQSGEGGENIARRVAVQLGLDGLPGATVNRGCASSLETIRTAANSILAGDGDVYLTAGVECVSRYSAAVSEYDTARNPAFESAAARTAERATGNADWQDPRLHGSLPDIYIAMGQTAENVATKYGVSRHDQDVWALESQQRAKSAQDRGFFAAEIVPVHNADGAAVSVDDSPRPATTLDDLAKLRPVFRPDGSVTAGNSCPLNDGAAAVLVMSDQAAARLEVQPLARIVSFGTCGLSPEIMGVGPVEATRSALKKAGMSVNDIDLLELNEAFASQVLASVRELGVDESVLNPNGGSIALGHPFGMTGARIAATLINGLNDRDGTIGVETMCVGGGMGVAMVVERLS
jgi:acetyl-CoA C-acetyltransferase